ncbi:LytTR family DNA-binding domain-containing protein [Moheibacter sediminis]|uniref:DNA-binding response regulator, LytR/AlgR family n=1 Tax=Moheibacter sediminis TaxID=1434700 RepID=A0A1W2B4Q3_9FLAO|nr:LytTR family DNA-binding domain-containing protein [Moheibacter sediminis]SMC67909.1 DNA-binding response regulator, LytR/AlgR family [Moheibacter sediminis]
MENSFYNFANQQLTQIIKNELINLEKYVANELAFIYLENDTAQNRLLLRKITQLHLPLNVVLVSENIEISKLAWQANLLHFLHLPKMELYPNFTLFQDRLMYKHEYKELPKKLKINFKGGVDIIEIKDICYCIGEGNYTTIFLSTGLKKTITFQLNALEKKLCLAPNFQRIGKSFIINIDKVSKIKGSSVNLNSKNELELIISPLYIKRLKKAVMWY